MTECASNKIDISLPGKIMMRLAGVESPLWWIFSLFLQNKNTKRKKKHFWLRTDFIQLFNYNDDSEVCGDAMQSNEHANGSVVLDGKPTDRQPSPRADGRASK